MKHSIPTYEKSVELLGFKHKTNLREGLIEMVKWAQKQPMREQFIWSEYEIEKGIYSFGKVNMILKPLKKLLWSFLHVFWNIEWFINSGKIIHRKNDKNLSIGLVTYVDRYDTFFKPLIKKLSQSFPKNTIYVNVNGYYDQEVQSTYLKAISLEVVKYSNVVLIKHNKPKGLSSLWNELIFKSKSEKILILNDDLNISRRFSNNLFKITMNCSNVILLNRSWSHFLITKTLFKKVGKFDEKFIGVGNEDQDYEIRMNFLGIIPETISIKGLRNIVFKTKNFSFSKNENVTKEKYSKSNEIVFHNKWEFSSSEVMDGFMLR